MQQLCLTGAGAASVAERLFQALNVQPVGLRILPFAVDGAPRGHAVFCTPAPASNGVPCRILLGNGESAVVPRVLEEIAAPGLLAALRIQAPVLISGLSADLLDCPALLEAVRQCMLSSRAVVITADAAARRRLSDLVPPQGQIWYDVPADAQGQSALLETLVPEAALRF